MVEWVVEWVVGWVVERVVGWVRCCANEGRREAKGKNIYNVRDVKRAMLVALASSALSSSSSLTILFLSRSTIFPSALLTATRLTCPSVVVTLSILPNFQSSRWMDSSTMMTRSSMARFRIVFCHFGRLWSIVRYSLFQIFWKALTRAWTLFHAYLIFSASFVEERGRNLAVEWAMEAG